MKPAFDLTEGDASPRLVDLLNRPGFRSRTVVTRLHDPVPRTYDLAHFAASFYDATSYPVNFDQWREAGRTNATAGSTVAYAINRLVAIPFIVNSPFAIDAIQFNVTTGGGAGSKARIGIYDSVEDRKGLVYPGNLLVDGGEKTTTSTGVKSTIDLTVELEPGHVYWMAYLAGTAAPTVRGIPVGGLSVLPGCDATMPAASPFWGMYVAFTYAALPRTFPDPNVLSGESGSVAPALSFHQTQGAAYSRTSYLLATWPIDEGTILRRARLVPGGNLTRLAGDAYVRVATGLRRRETSGLSSFELLGSEFDSREDSLKEMEPIDLVSDETAVASDAGLFVRVIQTGWPAVSLADAFVESTLGYEGGV